MKADRGLVVFPITEAAGHFFYHLNLAIQAFPNCPNPDPNLLGLPTPNPMTGARGQRRPGNPQLIQPFPFLASSHDHISIL